MPCSPRPLRTTRTPSLAAIWQAASIVMPTEALTLFKSAITGAHCRRSASACIRISLGVGYAGMLTYSRSELRKEVTSRQPPSNPLHEPPRAWPFQSQLLLPWIDLPDTHTWITWSHWSCWRNPQNLPYLSQEKTQESVESSFASGLHPQPVYYLHPQPVYHIQWCRLQWRVAKPSRAQQPNRKWKKMFQKS